MRKKLFKAVTFAQAGGKNVNCERESDKWQELLIHVFFLLKKAVRQTYHISPSLNRLILLLYATCYFAINWLYLLR